MDDSVDSLGVSQSPGAVLPQQHRYRHLPLSAGSALLRIHLWTGVALKRGTYSATLMPRWWSATSSQSLQITIVPAGQAPFLSQLAGGFVFTATYTTPSTGTPASADSRRDLGDIEGE